MDDLTQLAIISETEFDNSIEDHEMQESFEESALHPINSCGPPTNPELPRQDMFDISSGLFSRPLSSGNVAENFKYVKPPKQQLNMSIHPSQGKPSAPEPLKMSNEGLSGK